MKTINALLLASAIILPLSQNAQAYTELPSGWAINCEVDKFDDTKSCFTAKFFESCPGCGKGERVWVQLSKFGVLVSFGHNSHPGRIGQVRIDQNKAESFKKSIITGDQAKRILQQMLSGKSGVAETTAWPSNTTDFEFDLTGFPEAFSEVERLYNSE